MFYYKAGDSVTISGERECKWCRPVKIVKLHGEEITVIDRVAVNTFGIGRLIPDEAATNDRDLRRVLAKMNKHMMVYVLGMFITEMV